MQRHTGSRKECVDVSERSLTSIHFYPRTSQLFKNQASVGSPIAVRSSITLSRTKVLSSCGNGVQVVVYMAETRCALLGHVR